MCITHQVHSIVQTGQLQPPHRIWYPLMSSMETLPHVGLPQSHRPVKSGSSSIWVRYIVLVVSYWTLVLTPTGIIHRDIRSLSLLMVPTGVMLLPAAMAVDNV